jgi:TonB family protein
MGMQGETILEFDLYPNGDISAIKRLRSSGYALLDDNAVETVEVAYKEYPNPKEMTRIRLLVKYINDYAR